MSEFEVRVASQGDLESIYLIEDESFAKPYPHDLIAKLLRDCPDTFLVVGHSPGGIVGYCVACEDGRSAHLISIGVLQEYRRRGVGTALIQGLLRNLNPRVNEMLLEVKSENMDAVRLYEKLGFKQVEVIDGYYQDGSTAVKMVLNLRGARASFGETK